MLADEKVKTELVLKLADGRRDRRRGHVNFVGSQRNASRLAHGDEILKLTQGETQGHAGVFYAGRSCSSRVFYPDGLKCGVLVQRMQRQVTTKSRWLKAAEGLRNLPNRPRHG